MAVTAGAAADAVLSDESALALVLSFLHGFMLAGPPAAASRTFAQGCGQERLCALAYARDFALEEAARGITEGEGSQHLRAWVANLCGKSPRAIAQLAASQGRPALLAWAAARTALEDIDSRGRSALMIAAAHDRPATTAAAVAAGCSLELEYAQYGTALHQAAYNGAAAAAAVLCRSGAELEARNRSFLQTPLHVACSRNHAPVVQVLLQADADLNAVDKDWLSAWRVAQFMHSVAARDALEAWHTLRRAGA